MKKEKPKTLSKELKKKLLKKAVVMPYLDYLDMEKKLNKKKHPFCYLMLTTMNLPNEPTYKQFDIGCDEELERIIKDIIDQENFTVIYKDYYDRLRLNASKFDKFKDMTIWRKLKICFEGPIYFI